MTLEELKELGLEEDVAKKVIAKHKDGLKGFIPKDRFDEVIKDKKKLEGDLEVRDGQLEELKKVNPDDLKAEITKLEKANKQAAEDYKIELEALKINSEIDKALISNKAKNNKAVKALLDMEKLNLGENGLEGLEEQLKSLSESDSYLFESTEPSTPGREGLKGAEPGEAGDGKGGKPDIKKMNYTELAEYMANNPGVEI